MAKQKRFPKLSLKNENADPPKIYASPKNQVLRSDKFSVCETAQLALQMLKARLGTVGWVVPHTERLSNLST